MPLTYPRRILALFSVAAGLVCGCVVPLAPFASRTGPLPEKGTAASKADSRAEAARAADRPLAASAGAAAGSPVASAPAAGSADKLEARFLADWEAARKSGDKDIDREVQALMKLAAVDPCRAVSLAMKLDGPNATTLLVRLLESMKKTSHHALRALLENPRWQGEWQVVDTIFTNLAEVDPRMAWEEATKDRRTFANHVVFGIGQEWAKKAPREAVAFAGSVADRELRKRLTDSVFSKWIGSNPEDFIAWLRAVPDREAWSDVIPWQNAAAKTKEQFLVLAEIFPERLTNPRFEGESPLDGFFKSADRKDEYLAWVSAMPEGAKRDVAVASLAKSMLMWNPEDALSLLPSVKDGNARTQITSAVAAWRATLSPSEGVAYAESLAGSARALALRSVVSTWAESDPAGAAAFMVTRPEDFGFIGTRTDALRDQMGEVVRQWAWHDPMAAATFALSQKEAGLAAGVEEQMNNGLRSVLRVWVDQDAYGASAWVTNMPPGRARDIATDALADAAMSVEPEGALGWAMSIGDPDMRAGCIRDCVFSWTWRDVKSAAAWVKTAKIDEQLRAELAATVAKRGNGSQPTSSVSSPTQTIFY